MPEGPERLASHMNRLGVAMTHTRRRVDGKRQRKRILREMKHLLKTVGKHARRHRELLETKWAQTDYTKPPVAQIIARIERMLTQLPLVIQQAHERIIGARRVADAEKIMSVYEPETLVIVRGKAGRAVAFGHPLLISETLGALIGDWQLHEQRPSAEWQQVQTSLKRQNKYDLRAPIIAVVGDPRHREQARLQAARGGRHLRCDVSAQSRRTQRAPAGRTLWRTAKTPGIDRGAHRHLKTTPRRTAPKQRLRQPRERRGLERTGPQPLAHRSPPRRSANGPASCAVAHNASSHP